MKALVPLLILSLIINPVWGSSSIGVAKGEMYSFQISQYYQHSLEDGISTSSNEWTMWNSSQTGSEGVNLTQGDIFTIEILSDKPEQGNGGDKIQVKVYVNSTSFKTDEYIEELFHDISWTSYFDDIQSQVESIKYDSSLTFSSFNFTKYDIGGYIGYDFSYNATSKLENSTSSYSKTVRYAQFNGLLLFDNTESAYKLFEGGEIVQEHIMNSGISLTVLSEPASKTDSNLQFNPIAGSLILVLLILAVVYWKYVLK